MRHNSQMPNLVATGGKENELKVFDIQKGEEPVFISKNVRHDWLELRVPVWVTDMAFMPDSEKIVIGTGHHQIRVYDPKAQRRPVMDFEFEEYPITCLSLRPGFEQIVIGNTIGTMALVDLRRKGKNIAKFRGLAGAVRAVQCHSSEPVVASCGLDRYTRIHDLNTRKLVHKFYLKSRLNTLLLTDNPLDPITQYDVRDDVKEEEEVDMEQSDLEEQESDDDLWGKMDTVKTTKLKRKPKHHHIGDDNKRKKNKDEESGEESDEKVELKTKKRKKKQKAKSKET